MSLPGPVLDFLEQSAGRGGTSSPKPNDDLFRVGILDSFGLVDFLTVLEEHCGVTIPDSDVKEANFQSIEVIERYISELRERS